MKSWKAAATSVEAVAVELEDVDDVALPDEVPPDVVVPVDPIEASASNTAAMRPPPGGGDGAFVAPALDAAEVLWLESGFCRERIVAKADNGIERPLLLTELILMMNLLRYVEVAFAKWHAFTPSKFSAAARRTAG